MAIWKSIPGFEGFYSASNEGQIRNDRTGRILSVSVNSNGYHRIDLSTGEKKLKTTAHRAIASAFLGIRDAKMVVNHKDGDRLNNNIENLEWVTQKENAIHASKTGLRPFMKHLANGCRHSDIKVIPSNWNTSKASISTHWRLYYRFYDPRYPQPKQVAIASGINRIKDLKERQLATRALIDQEMTLLASGFNPFDGEIPSFEYDLSIAAPNRNMALVDAWQLAIKKVVAVKGTMTDIKSVVRGSTAAAKALKLDQTPISTVTRRHVKMILEYCKEHNPRFTNARFNKYRAYLSRLWRELIELELTDVNPVRDIAKAKETFKMRESLTTEELARIRELKSSVYEFFRYCVIFFYSGSRTTELFRLKKDDVNLDKQEFKVFVKKGKSYREDVRVIVDDALDLWREVMDQAKDGHFLFARGLKPGKDPIRPDQINRRWDKYVRRGLGIEKDFYSLKHTFADMIAEKLNSDHAATLDGHTTPVITIKNYLVGEKRRQRERIRKSGIKFG